MVIFMLAECPVCGLRYAVAPDVSAPTQWLVFERKPMVNQPSHVSLGGPLCVHGHRLDVTAEEALLTTEGHWLVLTVSHPEPVLN
jgi:hypothetical protein